MAVGASSSASASSSNSTTLSISVPIEMLVTRSRMTSTMTGTRYSAMSFLRLLERRRRSSGRSNTRSALQPRPSATLTWSTPYTAELGRR